MTSWGRVTIFLLLGTTSVYLRINADYVTHHWSFDDEYPYKDKKTLEKATFLGERPLNTTDYLHLVGKSCLILGTITDPCLANMTACNSGYSVALWLQINLKSTSPQIFLGMARNRTEIEGIFVYQSDNEEMPDDRRRLFVEVIMPGRVWRIPFTVLQELWFFITISWNRTKDCLSVYINGTKVNSTSGEYGNGDSILPRLRLQGFSPRKPVPPSPYLESGALYDEFMTWNTSLGHSHVKKLFQGQMNKLSQIKCTTTATELNVTWQTVKRKIFKNNNWGYRVRVWNEQQNVSKDLDSSVHQYFLTRLVPFAAYKVHVFRGGRRIGTLVCHTKEGVPTKVQHLTVTAQNSTSLLVQWSPPAQINGRLLGYNLTVKNESFRRVVTAKYCFYLFTDLNPNTLYEIHVQSYTAAGGGPQPPPHKQAATKKIPKVTETPQNLTVIALSWNTMKVTWTPLDDKEEVGLYEVNYCLLDICHSLFELRSLVEINDLSQYTTYSVTVRGSNKKFAGPWQVSRHVRTLDLDECSTAKHPCDAHAQCINTQGSYNCQCNVGFAGDGFNCQVETPTTMYPESQYCEAHLLKNISWTRTFKGKTVTSSCPHGFTGEASRTCAAGGKKALWHKPDLSNCTSKRFLEMKSQLALQKIDSDTAVSLADELRNITDPARDGLVVSGNLHAAVQILQELRRKTTENPPMSKEKVEKFMKSVVGVANNLLHEKVIDSWQDSPQMSRLRSATELMVSLEKIALMAANVSSGTNTTSMETENVVLKFRSVEKNGRARGSVSFTAGDNGIRLPLSEIQKEKDESIHVAFIYMKTVGQLLSNSLASSNVSTGVISLSTNHETGNFNQPVAITLRSFKNDSSLQPSCVFWKLNSNAGSWSTEGCRVHLANSTHTVCHCYHLTSFSVLMQYTPDSHKIKAGDELALSFITYIGISISLVALSIAFVTFCSMEFLKCNRNFAHINLVSSLFLAELLFVLGIDKIQYQTACFIIAVCLHYLFLVSFAWMATEGVILYLMLVKVFPATSEGTRKRLLFICAWGIPTIPVASAILINKEGYTTNKHCWLSVDDGFIWSFVGPVLLVSMVNIFFLGRTFKAMANRTSNQPARAPPNMRYWIKACAVLTCLLGTTWLLGLFFLDESSVVMAYLFNIFNVSQGLFIFIFHCLADERIRAEYKRIICCRGSRRDYLRTLRNKAVKKSAENKNSQSTPSSKFSDKQAKSEGKTITTLDDDIEAETRDSHEIVSAEEEPMQRTDQYFEISSLSETTGQVEEKSEQASSWDDSDRDDPGSPYETQSVDVFFEDISSSLIYIPHERISVPSKKGSIVSDEL
ncbi:latrophilin-like protein LAT-2 isoform X2 [Montipora foliosa]|uniref:latrophilin-like protein LAT-2 isoform X2 n=1 Tax=Montipora foliosa TaxID=591990 RepID=UPI0035F20DFA